MISIQVAEEVQKRCNGKCHNPACKNRGQELHHVYWKGNYKGADRDGTWNLAFLCKDCHTDGSLVIHGRKPGQKVNHLLDAYLKAIADKILPKYLRSKNKAPELIKYADQRKKQRQKDKKEFQEKNNGLTRSQVERRRLKAIKPIKQNADGSSKVTMKLDDLRFM